MTKRVLERPVASDRRPTLTTGIYQLDGTRVALFEVGSPSQPPLLNQADADMVIALVTEARSVGLPVLGIVHGSHMDLRAGMPALDGWGRVARELAVSSGIVPTFMLLDGPMVGGMALSLGLVDVVVATDRAITYLGSPTAVERMTSRVVSPLELGGSQAHTGRSGIYDLVAHDLDDAIDVVLHVLSYLPDNNSEPPPISVTRDAGDRRCDELASVVPDDARQGYDMRSVITSIVDDGEYMELGAGFGPAMTVGLATLDGHPVGIVANQPNHLAGAIDIECSQKAARFIQWCDALRTPAVDPCRHPGVPARP